MKKDVYLCCGDALFARMLTLELERLACAVTALVPSFPEPADFPGGDPSLLLMDLDLPWQHPDEILMHLAERRVPVILFGHPDSDTMTPEKLLFYDSERFRYVFPRPFLMNRFLYCVRELLKFRDEELMENIPEEPAFSVKQPMPADDLRPEPESFCFRYRDSRIPFTRTEFTVLRFLWEHRGTVVSRAELMCEVRKSPEEDGAAAPGSNIADVYIRRIRAKLDEPLRARFIETVRGAGYIIR